MSESKAPESIYDFKVVDIDGKELTMREVCEGKVALIVNVASQCGFTPQYVGLQHLYETYRERGLVVCAFPCNQFGCQEPGTNEEVKAFAAERFSAKFPMFSKVDVNGDGEHPLFNFLKHQKPGFLGTKGIKWNFTKFLVDREGKPVERYAPTTDPASIARDVERLL